jgi:exodeoxyribonuclease III
MRILAVNLRSGGAARTTGALIERCLAHDPDVVVFSEFRANQNGMQIHKALETAGLANQGGSLHHRGNGVLIASRALFTPLANPFGLAEDEYPNAIVEARFETICLYGVYLPGQDRKRPHLRCFIAAAQRWNEKGACVMVVGDFNSGRNETDIELNIGQRRLRDEFSTADLYAELEHHLNEAWLFMHPDKTEFSWYPFRTSRTAPQRNGWRLDKAFVSKPLLPRLRAANYDHDFRLQGLTDHSALIIDLSDAS